jgi:hypothetical protein
MCRKLICRQLMRKLICRKRKLIYRKLYELMHRKLYELIYGSSRYIEARSPADRHHQLYKVHPTYLLYYIVHPVVLQPPPTNINTIGSLYSLFRRILIYFIILELRLFYALYIIAASIYSYRGGY